MFLPMLRHSIIPTVLCCFWEVIILQCWLIINEMKGHDPCNFISITYFQSNSTTLVKKRLTMTTLIYLATLRNWPTFPKIFLFYNVSWSITHLTTHLCYLAAAAKRKTCLRRLTVRCRQLHNGECNTVNKSTVSTPMICYPKLIVF